MKQGPFYIVLFFTLLLSCESYKDIEKKISPKAVLSAVFDSDSLLTAWVMQSYNGVDKDDPASWLLADVDVDVFVNEEYIGKMSNGVSGKYEYVYYPRAYDLIRLEANTPYGKLAAHTNIPAKPDIMDVDTMLYRKALWFTSQRDHEMSVRIQLQDDPKERNFYMMSAFVHYLFTNTEGDEIEEKITPGLVIEDEQLSYHYDTFKAITFSYYLGYGWYNAPLEYLIFSDELFEGKEYELDLKLTGLWPSFSNDSVTCVATCYVNLYSISTTAYLFHRAYTIQLDQDDSWGDLGFREPMPTFTNVDGGYGLVAAQQLELLQWTLPEYEIDYYVNPFDYLDYSSD